MGKLLRIWNRLKRQLRSLIIRIGMKKPINWKDELQIFLGIMEAIADVRDEAATDTDTSDSPDNKRRSERSKRKRRTRHKE